MTSQNVEITPRGTAPAASGGCSCCGPSAAAPTSSEPHEQAEQAQQALTTSSYLVAGMTCGHCVSAVTSELSALDGVSGVEVDLVAGGASTVTVTSAGALDATTVGEAVDEAGYRLVEHS